MPEGVLAPASFLEVDLAVDESVVISFVPLMEPGVLALVVVVGSVEVCFLVVVCLVVGVCFFSVVVCLEVVVGSVEVCFLIVVCLVVVASLAFGVEGSVAVCLVVFCLVVAAAVVASLTFGVEGSATVCFLTVVALTLLGSLAVEVEESGVVCFLTVVALTELASLAFGVEGPAMVCFLVEVSLTAVTPGDPVVVTLELVSVLSLLIVDSLVVTSLFLDVNKELEGAFGVANLNVEVPILVPLVVPNGLKEVPTLLAAVLL